MKQSVVILHGWSDTSKSFKPLAQFLRANGYQAVDVYLGDYMSMENEVSIPDVGKRMEAVMQDMQAAGKITPRFDMIVHSTGGLVARHWLSTYEKGRENPRLHRLIMLAPANHGSKLASMGRSILGRVFKGWNNWFETGTCMLNALELSSPFQWQLALSDMFVNGTDAVPVYGPARCLPFVIVGSVGYPDGLRQIVNESGSDGTVRAAAANMNVRGATIDFASHGDDKPQLSAWQLRRGAENIPLAVLPDRNHGDILDPTIGSATLGQLILEALGCASEAEYAAIHQAWRAVSEETRTQGRRDECNQFFQLNVFVVDDHGAHVDDCMIEFLAPDFESSDNATVNFNTEVIRDVHRNKTSAAALCFYMDRTRMMGGNFYGLITGAEPRALKLSVSAAPPGPNVQYFKAAEVGAKGDVDIHLEAEGPEELRWLKRNSTHYLKIVIPRMPRDDVFQWGK